MSGSLVLLQETTITSPTASVTLTGISDSFNVYQVIINDCVGENETNFNMRVTTSGTAQTDSNYDRAYLQYRTDTTYGIVATVGGDYWETTNNSNGTTAGETAQGIFYLFNFNNTSEFSYITNETTNLTADPILISVIGAGTHKVASASNGLQFFYSSGNIASGTFKLYGLVK